MKILVTGSNGLLGQKIIYELLKRPDAKVVAVSRGTNRLLETRGYVYESADLTDQDRVKKIFSTHRPDVLIHTAAMTNVDACELNPAECRNSNVKAVEYLAACCREHAVHFIHLSTDFVFDGLSGPYREEDATGPQSVYAVSKLDSENIVRNSGASWCIIRTIILYGVADTGQRSNIVLWVKQSLEEKKNIRVITDQYRMPTLAEDLAAACITAAFRKANGIYHVSGPDLMSILEMACRIADFFHLDKSFICPVTSAELNQPAKRPLKTGFVLDKAMRELNYVPHTFDEGLKIVDRQLKEKRN